jgi:hypothetical protein
MGRTGEKDSARSAVGLAVAGPGFSGQVAATMRGCAANLNPATFTLASRKDGEKPLDWLIIPAHNIFSQKPLTA